MNFLSRRSHGFSLALAMIALLPVAVAAADLYAIDGDTIVIGSETIRVLNIDTPEIRRAGCDAERRLGQIARERLAALLASGRITLRRGDGNRMKDRYGRTLARVYVDGRDVGEILITENLARPWRGKRQGWCG